LVESIDPEFMLCSFSSSKNWAKRPKKGFSVPKISPKYCQL